MPTHLTLTTTGPSPLGPAQAQAAVTAHTRRAMQTTMLIAEAEYKRQIVRSRRTGTWLRSVTHSVTVEPTTEGLAVVGRFGTNLFYARIVDMRGSGLYGPYNQWIVPKRPGGVMRWPNQPGHQFNPTTGAHTGFNPGAFTLAGRRRSGRAGQGATYVYARRVRGVRPRQYARQAALIIAPAIQPVWGSAAHGIAAQLAAGQEARQR